MIDALRELWRIERNGYLARHATKHPGDRPTFWWYFDSPDEPPLPTESDASYLLRMGLLRPGELARIDPADLEPLVPLAPEDTPREGEDYAAWRLRMQKLHPEDYPQYGARVRAHRANRKEKAP